MSTCRSPGAARPSAPMTNLACDGPGDCRGLEMPLGPGGLLLFELGLLVLLLLLLLLLLLRRRRPAKRFMVEYVCDV